MSGNVWEWTRSIFKGYPYKSDDGREDMETGDDLPRVLRGGSFYGDSRFVRCACRDWVLPDYRSMIVGVRVVLSPYTSET
jgi:iron(II)-dependent oxidoreductase